MIRVIVNPNKIIWMMVLGMKTAHIIEGDGAEHPGRCDIVLSISREFGETSRDGRFMPNNIMEDTVHAA
jgi:hypothetical protein